MDAGWSVAVGVVSMFAAVVLLLLAVTNVMRPLGAASEYGHETLLLAVFGFGLLVLGVWLVAE